MAALCKGSVIAYIVEVRLGATHQWILNHVITNMVSHGVDSRVWKILGCALLLPLFDYSGEDASGKCISCKFTVTWVVEMHWRRVVILP